MSFRLNTLITTATDTDTNARTNRAVSMIAG